MGIWVLVIVMNLGSKSAPNYKPRVSDKVFETKAECEEVNARLPLMTVSHCQYVKIPVK